MSRTSKIPPPASARLFSDSHAAAPPSGVHIANIDGASRGNPGPASYAVVIRDASGKIVLELAKRLGRETNNVAEYYALLAALDYASSHGIEALRIRSDSELLVRQMQGRYKVKSADLKPLHERASKLVRQLRIFRDRARPPRTEPRRGRAGQRGARRGTGFFRRGERFGARSGQKVSRNARPADSREIRQWSSRSLRAARSARGQRSTTRSSYLAAGVILSFRPLDPFAMPVNHWYQCTIAAAGETA